MNRLYWPLAALILLILFLAASLGLDARAPVSPLLDRAAPEFRLPLLDVPEKEFSPQDMRGNVWLLNVWSTWCRTCRQEHAQLLRLARQDGMPVVGLNYKEVRGNPERNVRAERPEDERRQAVEAVRRWLSEQGNPFVATILDLDGRVGIDYGVYGVPETFLIDRNGIVRLRHVGPLTPEVIEQKIRPLWLAYRGGAS